MSEGTNKVAYGLRCTRLANHTKVNTILSLGPPLCFAYVTQDIQFTIFFLDHGEIPTLLFYACNNIT